MRWGNWYRHDGATLAHRTLNVRVPVERLWTPATVDEAILEMGDGVTASDVVHLHIAANELCWHAFDYSGVGDWVDDAGTYRGADAQHPLKLAQ